MSSCLSCISLIFLLPGSSWLERSSRWSYTARSHDEVVATAHSSHGFDDILLIVWNHLHPLQLDPQRETVFGEEG